MKRFFIYILIAFITLVPGDTKAQTSCSPVTQETYAYCCGVAAGTTNEFECRMYRDGISRGTPTPQQSTGSGGITVDPTKQCSENIFSFNYSFCCGTFRSQNAVKCNEYDLKNSNTIRGSSPSNNSSINSSGQAIFATPQSGAAELQQCSKIKFMSLLDILIWVKCIINVAIIPMLFALATLFFLWGVLKYIRASDSKIRQEAQKTIFAGLLGLFVMVSLWGIVKIFSTTLGTGSTVPLLQTQNLKK